jgi:hypothetical protein
MTTSSSPTLAAPTVTGTTEDGEWNYTVCGNVTGSNPASLSVIIAVDGKAEPAAKVTPVLDGSGHPTNKGSWTMTFGLAACYSATYSTRYCTAYSTNGTQDSPVTDFTIAQTPRPHG